MKSQKNIIPTTYMIVSDTGEIIKSGIEEGFKLKEVEKYNPLKKKSIGTDSFTKINKLNQNFIELLGVGGTGFMFSLTGFICYGDYALRTGGHNNGELLGLQDIIDYTGLSRSRTADYIKLLKEKHILIKTNIIGENKKKGKQGYVINPTIFTKGDYVYQYIYDLFKDYKFS